LYGLVGYFGIKIIDAQLSVFTMLFWRFFVAGLLVFAAMLPSLKNNRCTISSVVKMFLYGGLFYSASTILFFTASRYIGTGLSMVIFFTYPAVVMILNWLFYNARPSKLYYVAIAIIMVGLLLLTDFTGLQVNALGIVLGIGAAIAYACYIVLSKQTQTTPLMSAFMVSLGCAMTCLLLALAEHSFTVPTTLSVWLNISGISVICTALPILFLLEALKSISSEKASILSVLEPVFVVIFGIMLLNERVSMHQVVGIIVVLGGALITLLSNKYNATCK
jgi:drug/metabolite transporter (DMT)-like permease